MRRLQGCKSSTVMKKAFVSSSVAVRDVAVAEPAALVSPAVAPVAIVAPFEEQTEPPVEAVGAQTTTTDPLDWSWSSRIEMTTTAESLLVVTTSSNLGCWC